MIKIRKSTERGWANHGWLKSFHTFSFGDYHDAQHMGFGPLRVINEDRIAGGQGFASHPHKDMEIISYVIEGALEHKDSMGNATLINPGEVQRMRAGTGVVHSEYNHVPDRESHFLQIWIRPDQNGLAPGYGQKSFSQDLQSKNLVLVVSKSGNDGSIEIAQDVNLYLGRLLSSAGLEFKINRERKIWLQMIKGELNVNQQLISAGDGLAALDEVSLNLKATSAGGTAAEFMLFDMA